ncbi:MAG: hypothetical protein MN733_37765 [Nitrososphaera sp.]|nr:hypothetical protein [Nitrososphaera sp.]
MKAREQEGRYAEETSDELQVYPATLSSAAITAAPSSSMKPLPALPSMPSKGVEALSHIGAYLCIDDPTMCPSAIKENK